MSLTGNWKKASLAFARLPTEVKQAVVEQTKKNALFLVREIKQGIISQAPGGIPFKKLKDATKKRKKSSKALIDHGDLLRSVNVTYLKGGFIAFVGIKRGVKHKGGVETYNLALIHENGTTKNGGHIPARPFIRPIWRKHKDAIRGSYRKSMDEAIKKAVR